MKRKEIKLEKIDAVINDIKLYTDTSYFIKNFDGCHPISDLWTTRPKLHGDTDVIAVTLKPTKGKPITDIFPIVLRFDGTLEPNAQSKRNRLRRGRFAGFLKHYKITEEVESYRVPEKMKEWKAKKVKIVTYVDRPQVFVPGYLIRGV